MQVITYLFWAAIFATMALALWDCLRWPRQTAAAWRQFRPIAMAVTAGAVLFFVVNLLRFGGADYARLLNMTMWLVTVAFGSTVFFCGGWSWVTRAGHMGLFERIRRRKAGIAAPSIRRAVIETSAIAVAIVGLSAILFALVETQPSPVFRRLFDSPETLATRSGYIVLRILLAPLWEETFFRWYLPNRIEEMLTGRSWARLAAILASSALWAGGHATLTTPFWIKMVQIFAIGCLLAWRFPAIGLSGCILAHLAMNLLAILTILHP